jgi:hypothetical protein
MPFIDTQTFPILIISIPTSQFPDKLKIVMSGYNTSTTADANAYTSQVAANAKVAAGGTTAPTIVSTTWTESVFTETQGDNTVAKLTPPYNNVSGVVGYAHRNDNSDDDPINVTMYTTQSNATPSATTTTYDLSSVWGYQFTMTKQTMDSTYIVEFVDDTVPVGQTAAIVSQFTGFFSTIVSEVMKPSLPTAKQIASIFLGPAAAPVQQAIASVASQYAKIQPTVNQIVTAASAIEAIISNPAAIVNYLPAIVAFLLQFIPQSTLASIIYEFKGGSGP